MTITAPILAILCLIASGLFDLVLKLYASESRSKGILFLGIGVVWALLQLIYIEYSGGSLSLDSSTIIYGVSSAIFVTLSNLLLLECMSFFPISFASTVYRLNTIPLVFLAFFLFRRRN